MRVTREQARQNRERVVQVAGDLFRQRGIDSVSIADVMTAAGLTHGGFYGQFPSRDALVVEACTAGLEDSTDRLREAAAGGAGSPLERIIQAYLSIDHVDAPKDGCTLSALAGDAGRGSEAVQTAFAAGTLAMASAIAEASEADISSDGLALDRGLASLAALVGSVVLARAVVRAKPDLAQRIVAATVGSLVDAQALGNAPTEGEK